MIFGVCQICKRKGFMLDNTIDKGYLIQHHMNLSHADSCKGGNMPPQHTYTQEKENDYRESPFIQAEESKVNKPGEFGTLGDLFLNSKKNQKKRK